MRSGPGSVRLCFVCLGNICRSPTAAAVMRHLVGREGLTDRVEIESAGTDVWHIGEGPDQRAAAAAGARGIPVENVAAQFTATDFHRFDLVLAMDGDNVAALAAIAPDTAEREKIRLLRAFDPGSPEGAIVPDPFYGGLDGFEHVLDLVEAACAGLLEAVRSGRWAD